MIAKDEEDQQLRSVILENAKSILIARRRAERRSNAYLAEAQRLSHTGSFGWRPSTGEMIWSEETFRIFQFDQATKPTMDLFLQRVHPEDATLVKQTIERASEEGKDFEQAYRLIMPNGSVKFVHVVAHALSDDSDGTEFAGAVMDVTPAKRAEGRIREVIDTIPAHAWTARPDGSVDFINQRYVEFAGRPVEELLGWGWGSTIHPDHLTRYGGEWRAAVAAGKPFESEVRVRGKDGDYRWLLVRNVPLRDEAGEVIKWYGTAIEIEDRKRSEVLLAGEKRLLERIARGDSPALILEGACRLVEELASGSVSSILLLDPSARCLRHGAAPSLPIAYTKAIDGASIGPSAGSCGTAAYRAETVIVSDVATDPLWVDYRDLALGHGLRACWSTPILSSAGKVLGTFATYYREPRSPKEQERYVIERISHLVSIAIERAQAEKTLRDSEAYLAEAQRLTHTASFALSVPGRKIIHWSLEHFRLFGFDPEKGLPTQEAARSRIHPGDLKKVEEVYERAIRERTDYELDCRIVFPDGAMKYIREIGHPVFDESGNLVEYVGTVMDVTDRRRADEERERLRQAQADLAHVNRVTTMGELTAAMAHEVNQPIAAAITNAATCLRWLTREHPNLQEAREAASRSVADATRAGEIIRRIRLLFKKGTAHWELVDLNEIIREMIVLLRGESTRYSIFVRAKLASDLPPLMGDRVQLQQVMMNLMVNAIEAMKDVDRARELVIETQRMENQQLLVSVSDNGLGLPSERAEEIFNAFFTTKSHGTGMGLRISRSIVEAHGGRLRAADNHSPGASFYFTLPTKIDVRD